MNSGRTRAEPTITRAIGSKVVREFVSGLERSDKKGLVPGGGIEPPRAEARRILSPLRLPVPPSRLRDETTNIAENSG